MKRVKNSVCAFNISRQAFISLHVRLADTSLARLRGLLGKVRMRPDEGLWVVPSQGVHTFGLLFPIDVLYLDTDLRVIDLVENLAPLRIARIRWQCASVLQLPARSIYDSGTQVGDQLLIRTPEEMGEYWESRRPDPGKKDRTGSEQDSVAGPPHLSKPL